MCIGKWDIKIKKSILFVYCKYTNKKPNEEK